MVRAWSIYRGKDARAYQSFAHGCLRSGNNFWLAAGAVASLWSKRYISALPTGWSLLTVLGALLIGGFIGSVAKLEDRLSMVSARDCGFDFALHTRVPLWKVSSLLRYFSRLDHLQFWAVSAMACRPGLINFSLKSTLDFFAAMAFAASLGWGRRCVGPAGWHLSRFLDARGVGLGSILTGYQIDAMTITGEYSFWVLA